jgi:hypothetical protein
MRVNKPKNWEKDAEYGSDIMGVGSYQRIGAIGGKTKFKNPIGFIRPKIKIPKTPPQSKKKCL